jgi:phage terminase Nu1 subunit (DNA packaging protein)
MASDPKKKKTAKGFDEILGRGTGENGSCYRTEVIAKLFRVTVRRIQQLTQEGIISTTEVVEGGHTVRRYDLVPTVQAYIKYLSDKAYGKEHRTDHEIELKEQKMQADIALKESQGELHRLKTEIAAGKYIGLDEVKSDYSKFFITFKKFATSIPPRLAGMISDIVDPVECRRIEKEMVEETNQLLRSFVVAGEVDDTGDAGNEKKTEK